MRAKGKRILVVDDDPAILRTLRRNLYVSGYEVLVAEDGKQALTIVREQQLDLILLDLWLPGELDGLGVCMHVRQLTQTPIIVLSARTEEKQKVQALDLGADDYLTKPFGMPELQARVRVCLRRGAGSIDLDAFTQKSEVLVSEDGYLSMNVVKRQVRARGQEVKLTPTEFDLLQYLMVHAGKVVTHRILLRAIWGTEYGEENEYLRVYIRQLRKKIEATPSQPRYILTEPGIGYVFHAHVYGEEQGHWSSFREETDARSENPGA